MNSRDQCENQIVNVLWEKWSLSLAPTFRVQKDGRKLAPFLELQELNCKGDWRFMPMT